MRHTSTLNLVEERKKDSIKKVNDNLQSNTQYTEILPWKPKPGKPAFLERSALLLSYSFRIKGYMSNLGPHLRHNRHHNLLLTQEQSCSQFNLHLHDEQPLNYILLAISHSSSKNSRLAFTALQHAFFIGFTIGKTLKEWRPKTVTDPCRSLATNLANLGILLQSTTKSDYPVDYQSTFIRSSVGCHMPACRPLVG
jgi:hypothetical protein